MQILPQANQPLFLHCRINCSTHPQRPATRLSGGIVNVYDPTGSKARTARRERQYMAFCLAAMIAVVLMLKWL
jgi:hypothetical protein